MAIRTLSELFLVAAGFDRQACLMHKVDGRYVAVSTAELVRQVRQIAKALVDSGVRPGDRVALMAENGPHWPAVDFATLCIGAALVPIYPTLLPEGAAYVARDSGSRVLFVQGRERLEGLLEVRADMPAVERIVAIEASGVAPEGVESLESFMARGAAADQAWLERMAAQAKPEDLATLIYTSGTTGDPKGVMLTHDNLVSNAVTGCEVLGLEGSFTALSFLPLSHSFERLVDYCFFYKGITIAYAESVQTVAANLLEVKPHVFVAVPRVYEKVMARVLENATAAGGLKAKIFRWALGVGREALPQRLAFAPAGLKVKIADKLVFSKVRERLGGRFVFAMSGGAPLGRDVAEFFWGAGIPIYEGYGLTETSPVISVNARGATRLGTVGRPMPRIEVKIAEDGEILSRGPNTMRGYFGKPEATAEAIDSEGWFHTGDIGHLDDGGFLVITDRKKELIVNAYGKNIAPAPIENQLKASRWISQAVVIGDRRQYLAALIVPDFEVLKGWAAGEKLGGTIDELLQHPRLRATIQTEVDAVNEHLARYEQIRVWETLPAEFTLEGGELTPTLKVKRRVINVKYKAILDRLYAAGDAGGAH
ncbi:MAG: long-chain fatty acid--CoA ligase [Thermoanaerobaculia bacterium]|nr:long-chain fatty acid--CoA ligase [Thermoanaerobaculia bacterium]